MMQEAKGSPLPQKSQQTDAGLQSCTLGSAAKGAHFACGQLTTHVAPWPQPWLYALTMHSTTTLIRGLLLDSACLSNGARPKVHLHCVKPTTTQT